MLETGTVFFREVQKFNQWWVWLIIGIVTVITIGLIWGFLYGGLIVEVRNDYLLVKFPPFMRPVEIHYDDIQSAEVRSYNPLREYGGWGIKGTRKNRVYNVSGMMGVQLVMKDGRRILIGSQKAEQLQQTIKQFIR